MIYQQQIAAEAAPAMREMALPAGSSSFFCSAVADAAAQALLAAEMIAAA